MNRYKIREYMKVKEKGKTYKVYEKVNKDGELIGYRLKSEDMCEGYDTLREVLHILFGVDLN